MTLALMNKSFKRSGKGTLWVQPHPSTNPGSSLTTTMAAYLGLIYQDTTFTTTKTGLTPFAETDNGGIDVTITQEPLTYSTQDDKDVVCAYKNTSVTGKVKIFDADPAHWNNLLSSTTSELVINTTNAGMERTQLAMGGAMYPVDYILYWKMPSKDYPGNFDHYVFPCANFVVKSSVKLSNDGMQMIDVEFTCKSDPWLVNPDTNIYEKAFVDFASGPTGIV